PAGWRVGGERAVVLVLADVLTGGVGGRARVGQARFIEIGAAAVVLRGLIVAGIAGRSWAGRVGGGEVRVAWPGTVTVVAAATAGITAVGSRAAGVRAGRLTATGAGIFVAGIAIARAARRTWVGTACARAAGVVAGRAGVGADATGAEVARAGVARAGVVGAGVAAGRAGVGVGGAGRAGVAGRRRDQRQGAQQQADERGGAQVIQSAGLPGGLHRAGDRGQPGHRRRRVHRRQAGPGQGRGAVRRVGIQADLRVPLSVLTPLLGTLRVSRDHRPAQRDPELAAGLAPRTGQDHGLDLPGGVVVQRAGRLRDQPGPVQVNRARVQRGPRRRQPPAERDGEAGP